MAADSKQVNIRFPVILLNRIDATAGDDRSKWILEACRMRLDEIRDPALKPLDDHLQAKAIAEHPSTSLEDRKAIALQAMSNALMKEPEPDPEPVGEVIPKNRCTQRDQNPAGDWFRCIKEKGHKGSHLPSAFAEEY